jgi:hypothetical protein
MIGTIMESAVTITETMTVAKMMTVKAMTEMITDTIMDTDPSLTMTIINMSISKIIGITVIGIPGIHGNTIKVETPITRDMVVTKDIITNYSSCSMMVLILLCSQ